MNRHGTPARGIGVLLVAASLASACAEEEDAVPETAAGPPEAPVTSVIAPGPDIFVGRLEGSGPELRITALSNVTRRAGYDNQPAFTNDGSAILYTAQDSLGRTDVWRHDLTSGRNEPVTGEEPGSEYSPTPIPGDPDAFSAIVVEADSAQRLWRLTGEGRGGDLVIFPELQPVGYHAWAGDDGIAMFVLGDPPTLHVGDIETLETREVARDIGRSIRSIPGEAAVSFIQRIRGVEGSEEGGDAEPATRVMKWSRPGGVEPIVDMPHGGDDHAWTPDGVLLTGRGSEILGWHPDWPEWRVVGVAPEGATVSRMDVSPGGDRIAVVLAPADPG